MALFRVWGWIDYGRSLLRAAAISFSLAAVLWRHLSSISQHPRLQRQRQDLVHALLLRDRHLHDARLRRCEARYSSAKRAGDHRQAPQDVADACPGRNFWRPTVVSKRYSSAFAYYGV
jgi:hypothetical protein